MLNHPRAIFTGLHYPLGDPEVVEVGVDALEMGMKLGMKSDR
jgi:hypothetical protein